MLTTLFRTQLRISAAPVARLSFSTSPVAFKETAKTKKTTTKKTVKKTPAKKPVKKVETKKAKKPVVKQYLTPYAFFVKEYYKDHGEELNKLEFSKRGSVLSEKWSELTDSEKSPFVQKSEADKERFLTEKDEVQKAKGPTRPLSSYLSYYQSIREELLRENPEATFADIGKLAGQKWRELDDSTKKEFVDTYRSELEAWKEASESFKKAQI